MRTPIDQALIERKPGTAPALQQHHRTDAHRRLQQPVAARHPSPSSQRLLPPSRNLLRPVLAPPSIPSEPNDIVATFSSPLHHLMIRNWFFLEDKPQLCVHQNN